MSSVVRNPPRAGAEVVKMLGQFGVATIHEALMADRSVAAGLMADRSVAAGLMADRSVAAGLGQTGLLDPALRPIYRGARTAGTAVTVSVPPGDNLMIHVAVEQCREGDVLVVAPTSPSQAGYFGELLATSLAARGVRGLVIDAGCRDVTELERMAFPVWARYVCAFGTVKQTLGDVNLALICGGQNVEPGDVIVADDDGVVVVPRLRAAAVAQASRSREEREAGLRERYARGELGLDVNAMRESLARKGLTYIDPPPTGNEER